MPRTKKIVILKAKIEASFSASSIKAFNTAQLTDFYVEHWDKWGLPKSQPITGLTQFLINASQLREVTLASENYDSIKRYVWGSPSPYAVALTIKNKPYLTHGSAVFLHNLTDDLPKTVYLNYEQSPKPQNKSTLEQANINRAFANQQRRSNLIYKYDDYKIVVINGKHTGRLEVSPIVASSGETLEVTRLERTLIDITVRPAYAGGVVQVLEAFRRAKENISVNTLVATLKKLNYLYPYHQPIGFYMERAGYDESQYSKLLKLGADFDFYLAHALPASKKYDEKWRLFYPDSF